MTAAEIADLLAEQFADKITERKTDDTLNPCVEVAVDALVEIATFLRDDKRTAFDLLQSISAVDSAEGDLISVNHVYSMEQDHYFSFKVKVPRDNPVVPTLTGVWSAADWHERESYDLMGIQYSDHPNLVRILCADDWVGHPLRKDYEFPEEYHGIRCK